MQIIEDVGKVIYLNSSDMREKHRGDDWDYMTIDWFKISFDEMATASIIIFDSGYGLEDMKIFKSRW